MWDLSFLTRNQTCIPCTGRWILNYWTIKEVPIYFIYNLRFYLLVVSKKRWLFLGRKAMINLDSILKTRDTTLLTKVRIVKAMKLPIAQMAKNLPVRQETMVWSLGWEVFQRREWQSTPVFLPGEFYGQRSLEGYSSWGHKDQTRAANTHVLFPVVRYRCESWILKKAECWRIVVLEKTLESPLEIPWSKKIKPVNLKRNQPWIFIGKTDAEAAIIWPPDEKSQLIRENFDSGNYWGQEEKWVTEDEIVGWHHQLNEHDYEQTWGDSEGQGCLACCSLCVIKRWTWLRNWRTA